MTSSNSKAQKAFAEALARKVYAATPTLVQETSNTDAIVDVVKSSFNISKNLKDITESPGISDSLTISVESLASEWAHYRKTYVNLLWQSRTVAGDAEREIFDFTDAIMMWLREVDCVSVEDKVRSLPGLVKSIEHRALKHQDFATRLETLKKDVNDFLQSLNMVMQEEKLRVDGEDKAATEAIDAEVIKLALELDGERSKLVKMINDLAAMSPKTEGASGIITLFPKFVPPIIGVYGAVFQDALEVLNQGEIADAKLVTADIQQLQGRVDSRKAEKNRSQSKDRSAVDALMAGVLNFVPNFNEVADRLSLFSYLWYAIVHDLREVEAFLKDVSDNDLEDSAFFMKLASKSALYEALIPYLKKYQNDVVERAPDVRNV